MPKQDEDVIPKVSTPKRRRRKKDKKNLFNIPGVRKIVMSELTQKIVECIVGEHVSSENPWKYIKKELVQDNLELHEESSEFLPLRNEIIAYTRPDMLIGYIADETQDKDDEFYICVTEEATDAVQKIVDKLRQDQEDRLYYQLYKDIHPWQSMGTEAEVDESIVKNNRPLLEVEVETQYPIFPGKVQFRIHRAENQRDGYMELKVTPEENLVNVYMRRIDSAIQVAPAVVSTEAQTICTYPKNAATDYLYETGPTDNLLAQCQPEIVKYANEHIEDLSNLLRVNGSINLYADDFGFLIKNELLENSWKRVSGTKELAEYLSFMDVNLCKEKMISSLYWHPMWTGTVAVAYCDISPNIFNIGPRKVDEVYAAVHTVNPVLIWSFSDTLKPKLILETPREVYVLSFCKFNENILIGGCRNGQIVIWDIRNKLQKVDDKEVLTTAQQKYRNYMHSLMGWMKKTHDVSIVRPTAVSDLRYSHKSGVTGISWLDPYYEFSRTGNVSEVPTDEDGKPKFSMQFLTTSLDGTVLIWDLKDKPIIQPGGYKPKRLRRLKKRPSALEVDVSPYRILHLAFKPRYKINVCRKENKNKLLAISTSTTSFCSISYNKTDLKPVCVKSQNFQPHLKLGTTEGDFVEIEWEGQDFDSGEVVNCEQAKYINDGKYHDGPTISIQLSWLDGTILTVGGKVFAIWRKDFPGRPILWRKEKHFFTKGELNNLLPFRIITHNIVGQVSRWIFAIHSKEPVLSQIMSDKFLTASALYPHSMDKMIYGMGDQQGCLRLFNIKNPMLENTKELSKSVKVFIDREINRKKLFSKWQEDFNKRNESYLLKAKEDAEQKVKEEAAKQAKEEPKVQEKSLRGGPQPGKFVDWIIEQRQVKEEARIKAMIINKKQLDTKDLEKRRKPLQKLEEENERKKRKQKERLKQGETIFRETIESLFPDVIKEKPAPPPDPYAGGDPREEKVKCYGQYQGLLAEMDRFINANPFLYDFSFRKLLVASRNKDVDNLQSHGHMKRLQDERKLQGGEESVTSSTGTVKERFMDEQEDADEREQEIQDDVK